MSEMDECRKMVADLVAEVERLNVSLSNLRAALVEIRNDHHADCPCDSISWHALMRDRAACSCGEQSYNIHDEVCGWCGNRIFQD